MQILEEYLEKIEAVPYCNNPRCIVQLDNILQDILLYIKNFKAGSETFELKNCSWTLHERYYLDTEEQLKWTFHHSKHRIINSLQGLLNKQRSAA